MLRNPQYFCVSTGTMKRHWDLIYLNLVAEICLKLHCRTVGEPHRTPAHQFGDERFKDKQMRAVEVCTCFRPPEQMRFEAIAAVSLKRTMFCDVTPCSPVEAYQRFGGSYCRHLHGRRIRRASGQKTGYVATCSYVLDALDLHFDLKMDKLLRDYTASLIRSLLFGVDTMSAGFRKLIHLPSSGKKEGEEGNDHLVGR
jgi:hypothetical protein